MDSSKFVFKLTLLHAIHTIPYGIMLTHLPGLPGLPGLPSLPNAPIRSLRSKRIQKFQATSRHSKMLRNDPRRPNTLPNDPKNVPKHSQYIIMPLLTYVPYIHTRLCCPAFLACQTLPYDPKTLAFKWFQNASSFFKTVPNGSQFVFILMLTYIPYHDIQYEIMLIIPPHTPQNQTYGIAVATCIKSCMCSSFRLALSFPR